jgi:uncharacterized protein DUF3618
MGQDPGTGGSQVTREPQEIQDDIEATRQQMGETVEALAQRADVKAQAKQKLDRAKGSVAAKKDDLMGKAKQASPDGAASTATQMSQKAKENPMPFAAAGLFVAGFVAGRMSRR